MNNAFDAIRSLFSEVFPCLMPAFISCLIVTAILLIIICIQLLGILNTLEILVCLGLIVWGILDNSILEIVCGVFILIINCIFIIREKMEY